MKLKLCISCIALATIAGCGAGSSPEGVIKDYYRAVESGEHNRALTMIDPLNLQSAPEAKIRALMQGQQEQMHRCGGLKSVDVKMNGTGDTRTGKMTLAFATCPPENIKVAVRKVSGTWTINLR
jgi:hypothetical protein